MSSWLDILPANERERIREKFKMSAAAYEKLREKVKGPEDLEKEMMWNDIMARLRFEMESEPSLKNALKNQIESDIREGGIEAVLSDTDLPPEVRDALVDGKFDVAVTAPKEQDRDQLVVVPEGNIGEKLPVKVSLTSKLMSQLLK